MQFSELIDKRRSTRRFTDRKVENDTLRRIMEQALKAPSAKNTRSTRLMAVTDPAKLEAMASMRDMGAAFLPGAAAAIVVMGDPASSPRLGPLVMLGACGRLSSHRRRSRVATHRRLS